MPEILSKTAVQDATAAADAVWRFVTTVQTVKKRNGNPEPFSKEKLLISIEKALQDAHLRADESRRAVRILRQVITRLNKVYDGVATPNTADIAEIIVATFIDANLSFVARKYIGHRQKLERTHRTEAIYGKGISFNRHFTSRGVHPFEKINWEMRTAVIQNEKGKLIFEQKNVEVPEFWSQTATNIVASKYFSGKIGEANRETSARQLISRVAHTMADWGRRDGYFFSEEDADIFEMELLHILINQMAAFNSPVWFNVGIHRNPQCSACFINSVEDDMRSIMNLATTETMLFKYGSGTGSNLSKLRSSCEHLSNSQGKSSGVVSFMKGYDAFAGVVKSGGKTRRAAKMVILNIDHPDVVEFIECKMKEEKKAWALIEAGYDGSFTGEAYGSIFFQNANNSVRLTDDFMQAVVEDKTFDTREVTTGKVANSYKARELFRKIAECAWACGDPGVQYDTTINKWHTAKATDRINASNPCSEYMFLDDTACNLSSLNLMKLRKDDAARSFDVEAFKQTLDIMITAMEIAVGNSSYPTPAIEENSYAFRPLGIGYANLGALLMSRGVAYDSEEGRALAAAITSLMTGECYRQSAKIASALSPFAGYEENRESCLEVLNMHGKAAQEIQKANISDGLWHAQRDSWAEAINEAEKHGLRNAQISVLAPTGTISFLMDCDTTGVEPDIALVKYKWMVDGGMEKLPNRTVPESLEILGYSEEDKAAIISYIKENDTIEGAPGLKEEHIHIFDCAFKPAKGMRSINYLGHLRMMAAVQPFLSGAISKTVNLPETATVEDVEEVYRLGWTMGLKAVAVYRDGSKRQQPLTTSVAQKDKGAAKTEVEVLQKTEDAPQKIAVSAQTMNIPRRRRLPDERRSITHKFSIAGHKGYITVGLYDDGTPGEMFVTMSKDGSVISGLVNSLAATTSISLQYGVPLDALVNRFAHTRFEPSGFTNNPNIKIAKSIVDYIFRWMGQKFLPMEAQKQLGIHAEGASGLEAFYGKTEKSGGSSDMATVQKQETIFEHSSHLNTKYQPLSASGGIPNTQSHTMTFDNQSDAPACGTCGSIMVRNASCYKCLNCGGTSGCS
ncbi:MAG: vitamin B12-dependent ribonucleotide reductase [Patescibacteria group bacterium]